MAKPTSFIAWYDMEKLGRFDNLAEARRAIAGHPDYKKSWFGKMGKPTPNNPRRVEFSVYDNEGYRWGVRP